MTLWLPLWSTATLILLSAAAEGRAHLLREAHDLQPVALPDRSVGAGVRQLIHLLHRLDGGDLGAERDQTSRAQMSGTAVFIGNVRKPMRSSSCQDAILAAFFPLSLFLTASDILCRSLLQGQLESLTENTLSGYPFARMLVS